MNLVVEDREKIRFFWFCVCVSDHCNVCQKRSWIPTYIWLEIKVENLPQSLIIIFEVLNNIPRSIQKIRKKENVSFFARTWEKVVWSSRCSIKEGFFKLRLPANYSKKIIIPWLIVSFSFEKRSEKRRDYRPCREEPNIRNNIFLVDLHLKT